MASIEIPQSHVDLAKGPGVAVLSTLSVDQTIQSSLIWFDYIDGAFRINTTEDSPKARNLVRNPRATLLIMDNGNVDRYLSVRCIVDEITKDGAVEHLNQLTRLNMNEDRWYGGAVDDDPEEAAHRVIIRLEPMRIYCTE